jgi:hypothetical protein
MTHTEKEKTGKVQQKQISGHESQRRLEIVTKTRLSGKVSGK